MIKNTPRKTNCKLTIWSDNSVLVNLLAWHENTLNYKRERGAY